MIELRDVSKTFTTRQGSLEAVRGVSLSVRDGEIYGIIGFSGAGKSTLVRLINRLERPTSGSIRVDGHEITAMGESELRRARRRIGMIFQHFNLLPSRTVTGNIAYPLRGSGLTRPQIAARVTELLSLVGMADKADAYPSQLSGGQKQRVAIARALANNPTVLLCDEATSALDPQTTYSILQLLRQLNRQLGITIVIITHQMDVVKAICGRVAVMDAGRVVEENDVFGIFAEPREEITRQFIKTTTNLYKVDELVAERAGIAQVAKDEKLVRLSYVEKNVSEPLISAVSRQFGVDVNIIFSNIEIIQGAPLGGLVAILKGPSEPVAAAIEYLKEKKVKVEVIRDGMA